jgi:hypothetical protein
MHGGDRTAARDAGMGEDGFGFGMRRLTSSTCQAGISRCGRRIAWAWCSTAIYNTRNCRRIRARSHHERHRGVRNAREDGLVRAPVDECSRSRRGTTRAAGCAIAWGEALLLLDDALFRLGIGILASGLVSRRQSAGGGITSRRYVPAR